MHIALVHRDIHQVTQGGICTLYRSLAHQLASGGHRVTLVTQATPSPLRLGGIDVVTLPRTEDLGKHARAVTAALIRAQPDIAECSTWEFELLDYARRPPEERVPIVVRGDLSAHTMGALDLAAGERELLSLADDVIAVSTFARDDLAQAYGACAKVILNGVDRARFGAAPSATYPRSGARLHLDEEGRTIYREDLDGVLNRDPMVRARFFDPPADPECPTRLVWVGKMTEMKGWDRLQEIVHRAGQLASFIIVLGHGPTHYPVTIADEPHVLVLQDLADEDMPVVYRAGHYLLSTSRWEGFGLAVAEAMACGIPVLLPSGLGVGAEVVAGGAGGAPYGTDDDLIQLLRRRPGYEPRLPSVFDWTVNARATLAVYQTLLKAQSEARNPA